MVAKIPADENGPPARLTAIDDRRMSGSPPGAEQDIPARAQIIAPSLLLPAEIVLFQWKPSLWYVIFESLPIAAAGLAMVFLARSVDRLPSDIRQWGIIIGVSAIGLRVALALLQWLGRTYVLTDRRILMQYGVLSVAVECMGLEEIENTFVAQAAAQRMLGIGSIFFRCGTSPRGAMAWEHVARPKEVHGHIVIQIDRWKHTLAMSKG